MNRVLHLTAILATFSLKIQLVCILLVSVFYKEKEICHHNDYQKVSINLTYFFIIISAICDGTNDTYNGADGKLTNFMLTINMFA